MATPTTPRPLDAAAEALREGMATTHSDSDRIAYAEALFLVTHPTTPVSTDATYPNWTPGGAA